MHVTELAYVQDLTEGLTSCPLQTLKFLQDFVFSQVATDVNASGLDPKTQGSAIQIIIELEKKNFKTLPNPTTQLRFCRDSNR